MQTRREFLRGLKKWSKSVLVGIVAGATVKTTEAGGAWVNRRGVGGGGWANAAHGGGGWINRRGYGGGAGWVNFR